MCPSLPKTSLALLPLASACLFSAGHCHLSREPALECDCMVGTRKSWLDGSRAVERLYAIAVHTPDGESTGCSGSVVVVPPGVSVLTCGMCVSRPLGTESARHGVQHVTHTISHTSKRVRTSRTTGLHHKRARSTQRSQARAHSVIHFISFHFISFHFISFHFISFHFISFHFISFHFISFHFISFHFISFHFISFHFISFHFISFHFISFHFISFHFISFHFISFHSFIQQCQSSTRGTRTHK